MAGRRKTPGPPCSSAEPSSRLWLPISCAKILPPCYFANGRLPRTRACTTPNGDTWDRMLQQGIQLLDRFCQDDRVRIRQPRRNLQIKFTRHGLGNNDFVAYVDAIGELDGTRCLLEWKTTSSRYPEEPDGLLALDPQLVCYSWMTGISEVAQIVFVRKRLVEVQYLRTTITDEQRESSASWSRTRSGGSSPPSFCPTAASAFPRTPAPAVPMSVFAWGNQN